MDQLVGHSHDADTAVIYPCLSRQCGENSAHTVDEVRATYRVMKKAKPTVGSAQDILARIDRRLNALKALGKKSSDRAVSLQATGRAGTVDGIRKGVRRGNQTGISSGTLEKLAPVLHTTPQWLLTGLGPEVVGDPDHHETDVDVAAPSVPLVGYVSAGAQAVNIPLHENELDRIPAPPGATDRTRALEIRGDSLGELFDRWIVYFDDEQRPVSPDLLNRLCIVALQDGRVLVKKIKRSTDGGYDLLSNTEKPIRNVEIKWAARVKHMAPR